MENGMVEALVAVAGTEGQELLLVAEPGPAEAVRGSYRVPVDPGEGWLRLGERTWPVLDVSPAGLGVAVDTPEGWEPGQTVAGVQLDLGGQTYPLDVEVVHVSADVGEYLRCGLAVTRATDEYAAFVADFVARRKARLLAGEEA